MEKGEEWAIGLDFGDWRFEWDGYFVCIRGLESFQWTLLEGGGFKFIKSGDYGQIWRVGASCVRGRDRDAGGRGFSDNELVGGMFREKGREELECVTTGTVYRFCRRTEEFAESPCNDRDRVLFDYRRQTLREEWGRASRKIMGAGGEFPFEVWDFFWQMWFERMCIEQRTIILDLIRVLAEWAESAGKEGAGEGEVRFLLCFLCQLFSSERVLELFFVGQYNFEHKGEATKAATDLLMFFFMENLEGSSRGLWEEVLGDEEGVYFFKRGGLGQWWDWGDGEWESRQRAMKESRIYYCYAASRGFKMPD